MMLLIAASIASPARAGLLWYNGDNDNRDSLGNYSNVSVRIGTTTVSTNSLVYDNFTVPVGQVWSIASVFSDDQISYSGTPTSATWQIRSGVSSGNGGTLVASGSTTATYTVLTAFNPATGYTEDRVTAAVTGVTLSAGTYWLAVAPNSLGGSDYGDQSYIETTSGANAVGSPAGNDGNSFVTNNFSTSGSNSFYYTPTSVALAGDGDGSTIDFSMGVNGTVMPGAIPEPSSLVLVAVGLIAPVVMLRRRGKRTLAA
jgi:hypothetical protein